MIINHEVEVNYICNNSFKFLNEIQDIISNLVKNFNLKFQDVFNIETLKNVIEVAKRFKELNILSYVKISIDTESKNNSKLSVSIEDNDISNDLEQDEEFELQFSKSNVFIKKDKKINTQLFFKICKFFKDNLKNLFYNNNVKDVEVDKKRTGLARKKIFSNETILLKLRQSLFINK